MTATNLGCVFVNGKQWRLKRKAAALGLKLVPMKLVPAS
jgi:hypothetical protein